MFGKGITLFKLFGFEVKLDWSWLIIAMLVTWSLATGFFPVQYHDLSTGSYWLMGITGALGLFFSIIVHEFAHSLVARRHGMPMKGITLFIFGGVAEMGDEPPNARAEFLMAIVGPLTSVLVGLLFFGIYASGRFIPWPNPVSGVLIYLSFINVLLAGFNLIPAFPLDGGRVLRSILWSIKGNMRWATRVSSRIGSLFGILLIAYGFWRMLYGNLLGGMWMVLIGFFLQNAANASYQQLLVRNALGGEPVRRFMNPNPVTVPGNVPVDGFVEDYVYRHHFKMYPVVDAGRLVGCVSVNQVKEIPRNEWGMRPVGDLVQDCSDGNTVTPETDAVKALSLMNSTGKSRLMVVENGELVGIIALKDMLRFLNTKIDLEGT